MYNQKLNQNLISDLTNNNYLFNHFYAKLNFARQKYTKSLSYLENIKKTHYMLYLDSSVHKLCCYYELRIYEVASLELDKLGHYLRNHKEIPKDHRVFFKLHEFL